MNMFSLRAAFHSFISGEVGTMNDDASNDDSLSLIGKLDSSVEIFSADNILLLLVVLTLIQLSELLRLFSSHINCSINVFLNNISVLRCLI